MSREKDIDELCFKVLNLSPSFTYSANGPDRSSCPFCHEYVNHDDGSMEEIEHDRTCGYLIAKDLMTNSHKVF